MRDVEPMSRSRSTEALAQSRARQWLVALLLLSLLGLSDSSYLLWKHSTASSAFCPAGGCDAVNQGEYSEIRGIPLAAFGVAAYLMLLAFSAMGVALGHRSLIAAICAISGIGVIVSAFLIYLQVAVIESICFWCVLSAFMMTSIFVMSIIVLLKLRPPDRSEPASPQRAR